MTSSITEFTNESLRPISEPGRFIDVPDRQGYIPNMTSCLNEIKVIPKDEKEVNSAFTEPPTVWIPLSRQNTADLSRLLAIHPWTSRRSRTFIHKHEHSGEFRPVT